MDIHMHVTITEKELHLFYKYGETLRQNPCRNCPSHKGGGCCGCPEQSEWAEAIDTMPVSKNDWVIYSDIREYINALLDFNETEHEINMLLSKREKQRVRVNELLDKFTVTEDNNE